MSALDDYPVSAVDIVGAVCVKTTEGRIGYLKFVGLADATDAEVDALIWGNSVQ